MYTRHLFKHFNSKVRSGYLANVFVRLIEKTNNKDPKESF